jgi:hypothetical protein
MPTVYFLEDCAPYNLAEWNDREEYDDWVTGFITADKGTERQQAQLEDGLAQAPGLLLGNGQQGNVGSYAPASDIAAPGLNSYALEGINTCFACKWISVGA